LSGRTQFSARVYLTFLLPLLQATAFAQLEPTTADQVITRYLQVIGADHFSSINTFIEIGDLVSTSSATGGSIYGRGPLERHGTFEFFFKSPNLRFSSMITQDNKVIELSGCDGKIAWYIDGTLTRKVLKPQSGAHECDQGLEPELSRALLSGITLRLLKKREIKGHAAWAVKIDDPKRPQTLYFDAETFLLLRKEERYSHITYSDYRSVGQVIFPFTVTAEGNNFKQVTTVREIKINTPLDDARFVEPKIKDNTVVNGPLAPAVNEDTVHVDSSSPTATAVTESVANSSPAPPTTPNAPSSVEVNFPNFTSCTIPSLYEAIPELKGLKPAANQNDLPALLDKVGNETFGIARKTPNLISRETVIESRQGEGPIRREYDYLILARVQGEEVGLSEFRTDLNSGDKFQTDEVTTKDLSIRSVHQLTNSPSGRPPLSQGFATSWVHFYPLNQSRSVFRYLGEQQIAAKRMLVLAFAQKPESVQSPALVQFQGKTLPMFFQGVAWVDSSDFRILRLRTDLLSPVPEVSLHRLTADIQFQLTQVAEVASPLSLPSEVTVTSEIGGATLQEVHKYSSYRLFRARSKIVVNP